VYLVITFLEQVEATERAIRRLREFGIPEPLVVRARSAAAALSTEVPVFAGLRSLALGADDDRVLLVSLLPPVPAEELERLVQRVQLEMDADEPPMGRLVALPVISAPTHRRS
jgi:hypothetical protein